MSKAKFPARKDGGAFCVEVDLSLQSFGNESLKSRIQHWISEDWMPGNHVWKREWKTGQNLKTSTEEILRYADEFDGIPEVTGGDASELSIRMRGSSSARFWKDWLVSKFLPDLQAAFPEVGGQLFIRNCDA